MGSFAFFIPGYKDSTLEPAIGRAQYEEDVERTGNWMVDHFPSAAYPLSVVWALPLDQMMWEHEEWPGSGLGEGAWAGSASTHKFCHWPRFFEMCVGEAVITETDDEIEEVDGAGGDSLPCDFRSHDLRSSPGLDHDGMLVDACALTKLAIPSQAFRERDVGIFTTDVTVRALSVRVTLDRFIPSWAKVPRYVNNLDWMYHEGQRPDLLGFRMRRAGWHARARKLQYEAASRRRIEVGAAIACSPSGDGRDNPSHGVFQLEEYLRADCVRGVLYVWSHNPEPPRVREELTMTSRLLPSMGGTIRRQRLGRIIACQSHAK